MRGSVNKVSIVFGVSYYMYNLGYNDKNFVELFAKKNIGIQRNSKCLPNQIKQKDPKNVMKFHLYMVN